LRKAIAESTTDSSPVIWDPFCGGGSTIVEAQRLGLSVCGSDLNPIPVVISTALTVIPQLVRDRRPVFPGTARGRTHWAGLDGFTADVSAYADVIRERALKKLEHLYPEGPDGTRIFAWRWTWTVPSPDPARAGAMVPLTSDFRLAKVGTEQVWVEPVATADRRSYRFEVRRGRPTQDIASGTKRGRGASFQCILSGAPIEDSYVKAQARAGKIALRLMAAVGFRAQERVFIDPTESLERIGLTALKPEFAEFLHYPMPENPRWFSPPEFGLATYDRLFTPRQITSVGTFAFLVDSMREEIMADAVGAGWNATDERPLYQGGKGATAYCDAVMTVLGLAVGRLAQSNNALVRWFVDPRSGGGKATPSFDRHAIPMVWDFTETSPFGGSVGDWTGPVLQTVLRAFPLVSKCDAPGTVSQADATRPAVPTRAILLTDPPYYDNIGYAALSDFFYLVERPALRRVFPEVFTTVTGPPHLIWPLPRRCEGAAGWFPHAWSMPLVRFVTRASSALDCTA
jgi:putative DNA methylase